jgi:hypothetical protein
MLMKHNKQLYSFSLAYVWIEWGFGFFADDDAIVEDERLKEIYHKYVYVSTYLTKITVSSFFHGKYLSFSLGDNGQVQER